jgi:hypothetical protein
VTTGFASTCSGTACRPGRSERGSTSSSKSASSGARNIARNLASVHGHNAGMPSALRYQLLQPEAQIVLSIDLCTAALNRAVASAVGATARTRPPASNRNHDTIVGLRLGNRDQGRVADRAVRPHEHEEIREPRDRYRPIGSRCGLPGLLEREPIAPDQPHRTQVRLCVEPVANTSTSSECSDRPPW